MSHEPILSDRERAFEAKFAHDERVQFRAGARRDKLFVAWAAETAGLTAAQTADVLHAVLALHGGADHDAAMLALVSTALTGAGKATGRAALIAELDRIAPQARAQIVAEGAF